MTISVGTLDRKIWSKDLILIYLYDCFKNNTKAVIDMLPEGSCANELGLYKLLDQFCETTGYSKSRITIKTANMLERHPEYIIKRESGSWYEVDAIHRWLCDKTIETGNTPTKHFANFSSRTNWSRLWIATILDTYFKDKTLQTYHYDSTTNNYNPNRYTGLDDLLRFDCKLYVEAAEFIKTCPRVLDIARISEPIQHPENLKLLNYYGDIFVDIVVEPNVSGNCFLVTEKLWRPILARRPFIVMSNSNYLKNLHKLGFKTFNNFWSEGYDDLSEADRIHTIHQILNNLSEYTLDQLHQLLIDMEDILDHNYKNFVELTNHKIDRAFI